MNVVTSLHGNLKACARCSHTFEPRRSNQKYCSVKCKKAGSKNTTRGDRTLEYKGRSRTHYERTRDLEQMVYSVAPSERLGVMLHILSYISVDAGLRNILCDPKLLRTQPRKSGRKNIAQAASSYTQRFYGLSIQTYVRRVQAGDEIEGIEVARLLMTSPAIPNIKTKLTSFNVRCRHQIGVGRPCPHKQKSGRPQRASFSSMEKHSGIE